LGSRQPCSAFVTATSMLWSLSCSRSCSLSRQERPYFPISWSSARTSPSSSSRGALVMCSNAPAISASSTRREAPRRERNAATQMLASTVARTEPFPYASLCRQHVGLDLLLGDTGGSAAAHSLQERLELRTSRGRV